MLENRSKIVQEKVGSPSVVAVSLFSLYAVLMYSIIIDTINYETQLSGASGTPFDAVFALASPNSTGDIALSVQNVNYSSPDGTTKLSASSGNIQVTIKPQGQSSRLDLDVQLNSVNVKSPSFTGSFSSVKLTGYGYVLVDPTTNKLMISMVASTSVADILRGLLGV